MLPLTDNRPVRDATLEEILRIGLDIDGVLANWAGAIVERAREMGLPFFPHHSLIDSWGHAPFEESSGQIWKEIENDPSFWLDEIQPFEMAFVNFPVAGYITARPIETSVTVEWLDRHGFPEAPVITVGRNGSKPEHVDELDLDVFVDDRPETVDEVNRDSEAFCFLLDASHNQTVGGFELERMRFLTNLPRRLKDVPYYIKDRRRSLLKAA